MQHKMHVRAMKHIPWVIKFYEGNGQEMCRLCLPLYGFIHPMRTAWARKKINKQTNKQTRKAEKRNNNKKQKNKTKQTNQKKQRRNRRKAFIDFF